MRGFEEVPTKGAVTKFRQRMGTDFNRFFTAKAGMNFVHFSSIATIDVVRFIIILPL
jgi:hypothetical protein